MIFDFLKKQTEKDKKKKLLQVMFLNLNIPDDQKSLYIQALDILDESWIDLVYSNTVKFIEKFEIHKLEEISRSSFVEIAWMRKKEAIDRTKEVNSFNFLFTNI